MIPCARLGEWPNVDLHLPSKCATRKNQIGFGVKGLIILAWPVMYLSRYLYVYMYEDGLKHRTDIMEVTRINSDIRIRIKQPVHWEMLQNPLHGIHDIWTPCKDLVSISQQTHPTKNYQQFIQTLKHAFSAKWWLAIYTYNILSIFKYGNLLGGFVFASWKNDKTFVVFSSL